MLTKIASTLLLLTQIRMPKCIRALCAFYNDRVSTIVNNKWVGTVMEW